MKTWKITTGKAIKNKIDAAVSDCTWASKGVHVVDDYGSSIQTMMFGDDAATASNVKATEESIDALHDAEAGTVTLQNYKRILQALDAIKREATARHPVRDERKTPGQRVSIATERAAARTAVQTAATIESERAAKARASLLADPANAHLTPNEPAKNIRADLKKNFPTVKFSVTTSSGSIEIKWAAGPTNAQVSAIVKRYSGGRFNGMEDSYETIRNDFNTTFGAARYIFPTRNTDAFFPTVFEHVEKLFGGNLNTYETNRYAHDALSNTDLTGRAPHEITGVSLAGILF